MKQLAVVVLAAEPARGAVLGRRIEATGDARLARVVHEPASLREAIAKARPVALVADLGRDAAAVLAALEALAEPRPPLLVYGPDDDAALVLRTMRLGAREFVPDDADASGFQAALERVLRSATPKAALEPAEARVIAVLGAKGGVGTTFVASQLAIVLQALAGPTAILDLGPPPGDLALHLDLQPPYCLARAARETETLDATFLRTLLCRHPSGVQLLSASERVEDAELLRAVDVERAIALLRDEFQWLVIDFGRAWSEAAVRALDGVDQLLLITQAEVPALVNARRQLDLLERLGLPAERVHLVENRHGGAGAVSERELVRALGRHVEMQLPEDESVPKCANEGQSLGEASPYGHAQRAMVELARQVLAWCGHADPSPARTGLLERVRLGLARRANGAA